MIPSVSPSLLQQSWHLCFISYSRNKHQLFKKQEATVQLNMLGMTYNLVACVILFLFLSVALHVLYKRERVLDVAYLRYPVLQKEHLPLNG